MSAESYRGENLQCYAGSAEVHKPRRKNKAKGKKMNRPQTPFVNRDSPEPPEPDEDNPLSTPMRMYEDWQKKYGITVHAMAQRDPIHFQYPDNPPMYEDYRKYFPEWSKYPEVWDTIRGDPKDLQMSPLKEEDFPSEDEECEQSSDEDDADIVEQIAQWLRAPPASASKGLPSWLAASKTPERSVSQTRDTRRASPALPKRDMSLCPRRGSSFREASTAASKTPERSVTQTRDTRRASPALPKRDMSLRPRGNNYAFRQSTAGRTPLKLRIRTRAASGNNSRCYTDDL